MIICKYLSFSFFFFVFTILFFLCTSMTNFFIHALELFFLRHTVYIQTLFIFKDFSFFPTHTYTQKFLHIHSLLTHTRIPFHASLTHTKNFYTNFPFTYTFGFSRTNLIILCFIFSLQLFQFVNKFV